MVCIHQSFNRFLFSFTFFFCFYKNVEERKKFPKWQKYIEFTSYESHFLVIIVLRPIKNKMIVQNKKSTEKRRKKKIHIQSVRIAVIWPPWDNTVPCRWLFCCRFFFCVPHIRVKIFFLFCFWPRIVEMKQLKLRASLVRWCLIKINSIINNVI